jgi:hypothetical protein
MYAGIDCGVWHTHRAVTATNIRDLRVSTREQCLAACKARADCEAATFNGSGCWLRKDLKALVVDTTKSTYVLCPGESGGTRRPLHCSRPVSHACVRTLPVIAAGSFHY